MTRDIKFRAWNIETKNMIDLYKITRFALIEGITDGLFIPFSKEYKIMQCSGLKDNKRNDIYEEDIVSSTCTNFLQYDKAVVIFSNGSYELKLPNERWVQNWNSDDISVIGNTYENPELLNQ